MNRPVYEIIKISARKVFIVGISYPWISQGIEAVYEELKEIFPSKRVIYTDGIGQTKAYWYEIECYRGQIGISEYHQKIPNVKGWGKMLNSGVWGKRK